MNLTPEETDLLAEALASYAATLSERYGGVGLQNMNMMARAQKALELHDRIRKEQETGE